MKTKAWAMGVVVFSTILTSSAQILYKIAAGKLTLDIMSVLTNWQLFLGLFFYGVAAVMLVLALKYGELSVLYPIISLSFVWVSLLSMRFLGEILGTLKWAGIVFIIIGVSMIGIGNKHKKKPEFEVMPVVD